MTPICACSILQTSIIPLALSLSGPTSEESGAVGKFASRTRRMAMRWIQVKPNILLTAIRRRRGMLQAGALSDGCSTASSRERLTLEGIPGGESSGQFSGVEGHRNIARFFVNFIQERGTKMSEVLSDYITPAQAARELGVTPTRVRQFLAEGRLPCVKTPLGRVLPRAAVSEFAASRKAGR